MLSNVFDPSLLPCIKYLYSCMFKTARHAFLPQLGPGSFYYCLIYLSKMALMLLMLFNLFVKDGVDVV